jgi:PAS domain S-box-containing protein
VDAQNPSGAPFTAPPFVADFAANIPAAVGLIDASGFVVWANDECRALFAWDPAARPRLHLSDLLAPEVLAFAHDTQVKMQSGELTELRVHSRFTRLDGTHFDAHTRGNVVRFGPDDQLGMLGVITPIVGGKFDHPYRRALDAQRELICEWALDGTIMYCNRAYRDYFGFDESVLGRNLSEFVEADGETDSDATMARFDAGERTVVVMRHYDDGRSIEWANTLVQSDHGAPVSVLAVGRDATERLAAEEAMRRNEERFRTMVTYIWDSILLLDREGKLVDATSSYRTDLDYPPEQWLQMSLFDLLHPEDRDAAALALKSLVERGPQAEAWMELRARRHDGTYTWLELNAANLLDDPAVNAVILTVRNVERRKQIERELAERHAEAEAALRRRVGFVAQVSHELRNPLHGMLGLSELLANANLPPSLADAAWALYRQSTTMRRIVDDLLDVAQMEVGNLSVNVGRVDVQFVINDTSVVAREIARPGVEVISIDTPPELRHVSADHDRLRQAVANLLSNACKHTEHGWVRIEASTGAAPRTVRITVSDTGSGVEADDVARLFQPYERGGEGTAGVGLGLAIVKGTIEAMGGTVGGAPREGGGSMFWVELPMATADLEVHPTPSTTADHADTYPLRVLVVDDDPVNQLVATLQLRKLGAEVTTASSGDEGWGLLQVQEFDVAFIDVQMPGMNGLDLVRLSHLLPEPRPLTAIMTASATAADQQAAIDAGADTFVTKPATAADVRVVLQRRLHTLPGNSA